MNRNDYPKLGLTDSGQEHSLAKLELAQGEQPGAQATWGAGLVEAARRQQAAQGQNLPQRPTSVVIPRTPNYEHYNK